MGDICESRVGMEREMDVAREKLIHEQRDEIDRLRGLLASIAVLSTAKDLRSGY